MGIALTHEVKPAGDRRGKLGRPGQRGGFKRGDSVPKDLSTLGWNSLTLYCILFIFHLQTMAANASK